MIQWIVTHIIINMFTLRPDPFVHKKRLPIQIKINNNKLIKKKNVILKEEYLF